MGYKNIKDKYSVRSIDSFQCKEWLLYKHYAKRIPPIEYSFGLYNIEKILIGIITYGTPPSSNLRDSFGDSFKMIELNRLCINEGSERNILSYFVSASMKMLPKPLIIVSYADTAQKHHGYIYQATNFIYTGLSAKRTDWKLKGFEHLHGTTISDISRGKENRAEYMRVKFGDDFYLEDRSRKHRYFYFIGSKRQKKEMLSLLPYKTEHYPKGDNIRYDITHKTISQIQLF